MGQLGHLSQGHYLLEADHGEVGLVDLEEGGRVFANGRFIVAQVGLVGRPHLPEDSPGTSHHLGDAKGPPDLHQLPPGDDHLPAKGQGIEGQQDCGGVVVDHHRLFGPG